MTHFLVSTDIMPPKQSEENEEMYRGTGDSETLYIPIPSFISVPDDLPGKESKEGSFAWMSIAKSEGFLFPMPALFTDIFTNNNPFNSLLFDERDELFSSDQYCHLIHFAQDQNSNEFHSILFCMLIDYLIYLWPIKNKKVIYVIQLVEPGKIPLKPRLEI